VDGMTVRALRDALRARGMATDGVKATLAARLLERAGGSEGGTKRAREGGAARDGDGDGGGGGDGDGDGDGGTTATRATKRRRWEDGDGAEGAGEAKPEAVVAKPKAAGGLDKAALLKQKQALLKQKELAAKLKAKKVADEKAKAAAGSRPSARPMALRLDAQGREIDERGELVVNKVIETSTLSVNLKQQRANAFAQAQAEAQAEIASQAGADFDDPRMRAFAGKTRKKRSALQVRLNRRDFQPPRDFFFVIASFKAPW